MVVAEVQGFQEVLMAAESLLVLVGLQRPLQGADLTAPEAAEDAGLQAAGPDRHAICRGGSLMLLWCVGTKMIAMFWFYGGGSGSRIYTVRVRRCCCIMMMNDIRAHP